ncbi:MAG: low molecular weight protein-tyrosine-phosphatase [Pirellulaceae bacterium]|nr:low molecular weight phosphotyrosine protein phosphatase [Planctomycetales bacterium]
MNAVPDDAPAARRVLFVCMGNICRSPAGEGVFRALVEREGLSHLIDIDSAGTIGYHSGKPADARMRQAASTRGYDLTSISRQVRAWDLDEFDLVIAMDRDNLADLQSLSPSPKAHVCLLSDFLEPRWPRDVPDPYYGGEPGFHEVLDMIEAACPAILARLVPDRVP